MSGASLGEPAPSAVAPAKLNQKTWVMIIVVVLAQALGDFALNRGLKHQHRVLGLSPIGYIEAIFSPWVALGIMLLMLWLFSRMTLLSWADLSFVLPLTSFGYVLATLIGRYYFQEQVSRQRWTGTLLIICGMALVGMTRPNTTTPAPVRESD